ncbi:hypothetical protein [Micromonospora sp. NBC_01813]|uniref:hypothetical protein n=1 Tax=Micromonospora sp. NBC_01813 TaxID=2975988 RepID=UPI002DD9F4FF|nr:hypothetical protein [Micromonospora sp. NBC_01813]WSA11860.1 hypothetical protein OG958_14370 [Micromonospora sp. NBC_01813]
MIEAAVHLAAQPRLDTLVTELHTESRRLRTDYAGVAWIGDRPAAGSGMAGPDYTRRAVDAVLFLPDTHWYDVDTLDDVEVQVTAGLLQVAPTARQSQGLVGALAEPTVDFFEHPEGEPGVGLCLQLRGEIWSNLGVSYRVSVLCRREALLRVGDTDTEDGADTDTEADVDVDGQVSAA